MIIIGITGGIASGKSAVARGCVDSQAAILSADLLGHQVLTEPDFKESAWKLWGERIFRRRKAEELEKSQECSVSLAEENKIDWEDWEIDRPALAAVVFTPSDEQKTNLTRLNELTHPAIQHLASQKIDQLQREGIKILFLDAPLLYETGMDRLCEVIVFVETDQKIRAERAAGRGWKPEELERRESAQWPIEKKRSKADFVIENNGLLEEAVQKLKNWIVTQYKF